MPSSRAENYEPYSVNHASPVFETPRRPGMESSSSGKASRSSGRIKKVRSTEHVPMAWLLALLTLILLALTTLYAAQTTFKFKTRMAFASRSHAIFILRALSELTGLSLAATIAATFERVQWLRVVRKDGVRLADYLALQAGTGMMGLLALTAGGGVLHVTTRVLSAVRLVSIVLIPVLGVLIMSKSLFSHPKIYITRFGRMEQWNFICSTKLIIGVVDHIHFLDSISTVANNIVIGNVQTQFAFQKLDQLTLPLGFGLGPMNVTVAEKLSMLTDVLFGAAFTMFLMDSNHAIDITPASSRQKSCSQGIDVRGGQTCEQVVFLAAGIDQVGAEVATVTASPNADVWLAEDHQGYVLHFTEGNRNWEFDNATDCRVYYTQKLGTTLGAFMMCSKNTSPNTLQARKSSHLFLEE